MKVALLNPPYPESFNPDMAVGYPLGLYSLAAVAEQQGVPVEVRDLAHETSWARVEAAIRGSSAELFGIRSLSPNRGATARLVELIRRCHPHSRIVLGGQHASVLWEPLLRRGGIDGVFIGEAEESFRQFLRQGADPHRSRDIPGLAQRIDGEVVCRPVDPHVNRDLDALPLPAYHLIDYHLYAAEAYGSHILTSRGCPFRCSFCAVPVLNKRFRRHSVERAIEEIRALFRHHPQDPLRLYVHDDFFSLAGGWTESFCEALLRLDFRVAWIARTRGDSASPETLRLMKRSGCQLVSIGVESGCPDILHRMNKRLDLDATLATAHLIQAAGIEVGAYFILGYPGETLRSMGETLRFIRRLRPDQFSVTFPRLIPGTPLYEEAVRAGAIDDDYWLRDPGPGCPVYSDMPLGQLVGSYFVLKLLGERAKLDLVARAARFYGRRLSVAWRRRWDG